ncbi:uncharacterized protein LOC125323096 [Corvus hawaiiensis]|uniref:uncharacterized protein LOC125323096 n=1 Tax=Corvus hawaiiensis TaxID=134902 RepID=UPI0020184804|nr:uncharacterized protein LOC125323096 [Corvus hawaiiensis]
MLGRAPFPPSFPPSLAGREKGRQGERAAGSPLPPPGGKQPSWSLFFPLTPQFGPAAAADLWQDFCSGREGKKAIDFNRISPQTLLNRVKASTKKIHSINILPKKGRFTLTPSTGSGILCQETVRGAEVGLEKGEKTSSLQCCHFGIAAMSYTGVTLNLPAPGRFSVLRECVEAWRQRGRLEVFLQEEKIIAVLTWNYEDQLCEQPLSILSSPDETVRWAKAGSASHSVLGLVPAAQEIFPSHRIFHMLEILNPTELPGDDWIKQGCWIYEEEKKLLAPKGQLRESKPEV